jgi:hypothetical protein
VSLGWRVLRRGENRGTASAGGVYVDGVTFVRAMMLAGAAAATAVGVGHAASPHRVVEDCSTASSANFPGAFTRPENLVVGPLVMIGARGSPAYASPFHGNKFPLLVRNGHRVTLELSRPTRKFAGLAYGPLPQGETNLRDTHRVVTFIACASADSASMADGQPLTFWSGGIVARAPACVPLRVWIDGKSRSRRAVIRLGVQRCN